MRSFLDRFDNYSIAIYLRFVFYFFFDNYRFRLISGRCKLGNRPLNFALKVRQLEMRKSNLIILLLCCLSYFVIFPKPSWTLHYSVLIPTLSSNHIPPVQVCLTTRGRLLVSGTLSHTFYPVELSKYNHFRRPQT